MHIRLDRIHIHFSTMGDPTNTVPIIRHLKQHIWTLVEEHEEALRSATYLGMTEHEAYENDERLNEITTLVRELDNLQKPR